MFTPGTTIMMRDGAEYSVARDLRDAVEFVVPAARYRTRGGDCLLVPGGNLTVISKADLAESLARA